ncbi:aspartyl/glutamyl-tRNA(Asn/Gln) amidotransferase subunit C [Tyzzerella sp. An114]|uniref:Asp-tRNA(Asn)/Glu-tRNA(Gln) amidotransferase subunit GatC n=1 Tax=Tyzzerella sp. An114 TaxID=1965545 RepID=UPI000B451696|nr:Asp-tRNA(Asn)/Glu-tRNA(Gln) amidotransferase subunit GatC [Tyzzerella sp. An114]OUQ59580.1 aspartyl/glutamyl-tRNA(Asn/Gln) amidotransferase subunit C [Tyzzerella sp. An114]HIT73047.1 Asp-tRNA(Asn)/Glu-tRNA(Gln) amidotransferase subunit GatC [Candidatus Fimicola cottocaccae]
MKITDEMIDYISQLARLELSGEEREKGKEEIGKIIDYMDTLNTLDTTDIEAMSHAFPVKNVFREDVVKPSVDRDIITLNAPNKKEGCFKVPKTVE